MTYKDGEKVGKNIRLSFIDSCIFMASSSDKLTSNLDDDQFENLREFYTRDKVFKVMRRIRVCRYEYMDSWEKFEKIKLPVKNVFYSKLNVKGMSDQDYEHV